MDPSSSDSPSNVGRRDFIKSLFGLGGVFESNEKPSKPKAASGGRTIFFWSDLQNGKIGFPTGFMVDAGLPGSVMKLVTSAALLEEKLVSPNDHIDCHGHTTIDGQKINCLLAHGKVDLVHALALSCNVYFATVSKSASQTLILDYAKRLGLGSPVGSIKSPLFPKPEGGSAWAYALGLNPNLHPNALQLLRLSALIASNGDIPYLHSAEENADGKPRMKVELSDLTWTRLQKGMEMAVREGTAHKLDPEYQMRVAAKTGTAPHGKKFQSWVTGYFPYDAPKYAFCLGATNGTSQESAIPKAKEFLMSAAWP